MTLLGPPHFLQGGKQAFAVDAGVFQDTGHGGTRGLEHGGQQVLGRYEIILEEPCLARCRLEDLHGLPRERRFRGLLDDGQLRDEVFEPVCEGEEVDAETFQDRGHDSALLAHQRVSQVLRRRFRVAVPRRQFQRCGY